MFFLLIRSCFINFFRPLLSVLTSLSSIFIQVPISYINAHTHSHTHTRKRKRKRNNIHQEFLEFVVDVSWMVDAVKKMEDGDDDEE